jgi:hypothetical protein
VRLAVQRRTREPQVSSPHPLATRAERDGAVERAR